MFNKVLVANRGAVAARVLRALKALGIRTVAVYSEADASLPYLALADETYAIGDSDPRVSYLNADLLLDVLRRSGADGLHPGYGFLSENAAFAPIGADPIGLVVRPCTNRRGSPAPCPSEGAADFCAGK